jgi:quinol-cytochrome oxidoreductase complex cytochrome b subunit
MSYLVYQLREQEPMNVITARGLFGLIGVVYAIGVCIHFWWVLAIITGLLLIVKLSAQNSKPRSSVPAATLAEARRLQSYYSNRR